MTKRIGNIIIIETEKEQQCDICGQIAELRPYGPKGECICYDCGKKNEESTARQMFKQLFDSEAPEGYKLPM